jgi:hypothetical protein
MKNFVDAYRQKTPPSENLFKRSHRSSGRSGEGDG